MQRSLKWSQRLVRCIKCTWEAYQTYTFQASVPNNSDFFIPVMGIFGTYIFNSLPRRTWYTAKLWSTVHPLHFADDKPENQDQETGKGQNKDINLPSLLVNPGNRACLMLAYW